MRKKETPQRKEIKDRRSTRWTSRLPKWILLTKPLEDKVLALASDNEKNRKEISSVDMPHSLDPQIGKEVRRPWGPSTSELMEELGNPNVGQLQHKEHCFLELASPPITHGINTEGGKHISTRNVINAEKLKASMGMPLNLDREKWNKESCSDTRSSVVTESAKYLDISGIGIFFSLFSVCALHTDHNCINGP